jgi:phosphohistidine phosphatase SixA
VARTWSERSRRPGYASEAAATPGTAAWQTLVVAVLLVRHAHAGSRRDWADDDDKRRLSAKGRRQAKALVGMLSGYSPTRIVASPAVRCRETLEPLAEALGLEIEVDADLAEGEAVPATSLVLSLAGEAVALCTHGDVIPAVLTALAGDGGVNLDSQAHRVPRSGASKGSVWVLEALDGRFVRAEYRPPLA